MVIKSILGVFNGDLFELNALEMIMLLAKTYQAEAQIVHISAPIVQYPDLYSADISLLTDDNRARADRAALIVRAAATRYQLDKARFRSNSRMPQVAFRAISGSVRTIVSEEGRVSDIVVIAGEDAAPTADAEPLLSALFYTGRPVLLVPGQAEMPLVGDLGALTVAVAWDGSLQAARALYNALPFIGHSQPVYLICAREHGKSMLSSSSTQRVAQWLALHGIKTIVETVSHADGSVGHSILAKAEQIGARLIVMGAYGHNHAIEMMLGGTTFEMVRHSDIPLFLSH